MFVQFKGCLILNHTVMYALTDTKCWWWWSAPLLQIFHVLSIIRVLMWREPVAADAECCCKTSQVARHKGRSRWCGVFDIDSQEITLINVKYLRQEQNYSPFFLTSSGILAHATGLEKKKERKRFDAAFAPLQTHICSCRWLCAATLILLPWSQFLHKKRTWF